MSKYKPIKYLLFTILLCVEVNTFAQSTGFSSDKNVLYVEVLGAGGYGSLNYERLFFSFPNIRINARIGLGTYHIYDFMNDFNPDLIFPVAVNAFYGKKHNIEIGLGETISNTVYAERKTFEKARQTDFSTTFNIGYRYQKVEGGFLFRIAYTPIIEYNKNFKHWFGLSFGYAF